MDTVYVVISENGEYSDRDDWVSGVFTDREEALRLVTARDGLHRQYEIEYKAWFSRRREGIERVRTLTNVEAGVHGRMEWGSRGWQETTSDPLTPEKLQEIDKEIGPQPKFDYNNGERCYLVEVPLNQWGRFPI